MKNKETGDIGEDYALRHLLDKGYALIEKNYRHGRGEIDLIMQWKEELIFIEVKTRSSLAFGMPEMAVGKRKQNMLAKTATHYLEQLETCPNIRFDIVAVLYEGKKHSIHHIEDAFYPMY